MSRLLQLPNTEMKSEVNTNIILNTLNLFPLPFTLCGSVISTLLQTYIGTKLKTKKCQFDSLVSVDGLQSKSRCLFHPDMFHCYFIYLFVVYLTTFQAALTL
jgi:hypothetical protein